MGKYKHLTQDALNKIRKGLSRKEVILFKRYKHGDAQAEGEIKQLVRKEREIERAAHQLNLYWY